MTPVNNSILLPIWRLYNAAYRPLPPVLTSCVRYLAVSFADEDDLTGTMMPVRARSLAFPANGRELLKADLHLRG